jgi:hypothetical protein
MVTTAVKSTGQIVSEIESYMRQHGGVFSDWYVGVASDARTRLFNDHNVAENGDAWVFRDCGTDTASRAVEEYFLKRGCDGGPGGGDYTSRYVYAYKKTWRTRQ